MYRIIEKNKNKYIRLRLIPIIQKSGKFYISKIPAAEFLKIYTVEPAEYDLEKEVSLYSAEYGDENEKDYYIERIDKLKNKINKDPFQRSHNPQRVREISNFINKEEYAFFPNSIIVTCDLLNDCFDISETVGFDKIDKDILVNTNMSYLEKFDDYFLYIPVKEDSILIIDGQHRIRGLEKANKEVIENYEIILTFLIEYDRSIIARQFYTINYTQKSVNKSLLYHLTSEFSNQLDEITYLHEVLRILNVVNKSPFFGRIKMLGNIPEKTPPDKKDFLTISQAFLIDNLLRTITLSSRQSIYAPIFYFYYKNEEKQIEVLKFLIKYFTAIKNIKNKDWDDPKSSILWKTVGVGSFIKILHIYFIKIFIDEMQYDPMKISEISIEKIENNLRGFEEIDFSVSGPLGRVASSGQLNKVKEQIILKINYFDAQSYAQFIEEFQNYYLPKFYNWIKTIK